MPPPPCPVPSHPQGQSPHTEPRARAAGSAPRSPRHRSELLKTGLSSPVAGAPASGKPAGCRQGPTRKTHTVPAEASWAERPAPCPTPTLPRSEDGFVSALPSPRPARRHPNPSLVEGVPAGAGARASLLSSGPEGRLPVLQTGDHTGPRFRAAGHLRGSPCNPRAPLGGCGRHTPVAAALNEQTMSKPGE